MGAGDNQKLEVLIGNLIAETRVNREANEALLKHFDKGKAEKKKSEDEEKKQSKSLKNLVMTLPGVTKAVRTVGDDLKATIQETFALQKRSLALGLTFSQMTDKVGTNVDHLSNSMTGYSDALETSFQMYEAGSRQNNKAIGRLALATKLTGGNSKKLLQGLMQNTAGLGISQEGMSQLADTTLSMSQKFGMSTNQLVDAVGSLGDQLADFGALNIGVDMQDAATRLSAAMGPAMANLGPELLGSFTKGGNIVKAAIFGVTKERQALLRGEAGATKNAFDMMIKAGKNAEKIAERWTEGAADPAFALEKAAGIYGKELTKSIQFIKNMRKRADEMGMSIEAYAEHVRTSNEINENFTKTWENFKSVVVGPFKEVLTTFMKGLIEIFNNDFVKGVTKLAIGIGLFVAAIGLFKKSVLALGVLGKIGAGIKEGFKGGLKGMKNFFKGGGASKAGGAKPTASELFGQDDVGEKGKGLMESIGKGLKDLGKGLAGFGKGFGKMIQGVLTGIAKGVEAFGSTKVLKGIFGILALGASLIPMVFSLRMMKGVGIGAILGLAAALVIFAAAAFGLGMLLGTGAGLVWFALGVAGIFALGVALLPLAAAITVASPGIEALGVMLGKLAKVPLANLLLLGPALAAMAVGLVALSAGGLIGSVLDALGSLFGGDSPVDKIVKMGEAAKHINKMAVVFDRMGMLVKKANRALAKISLAPFKVMAEGLSLIKAALDKFGILDMLKFALFGGAARGATEKKKKDATRKGEGIISGRVGKDPRRTPEGGIDWAAKGNSNPEAQRIIEMEQRDTERTRKQGFQLGSDPKNRFNYEGSGDPEKLKRQLASARREKARREEAGKIPSKGVHHQIRLLEKAITAIESGNDQRDEGNADRRAGNAGSKERPAQKRGQSAPGSLR